MKLKFAVAALAALWSLGAQAQTWTPPSPEQRCPSKWGAADERGAANHMNPARVAAAAKLIRTGQTV